MLFLRLLDWRYFPLINILEAPRKARVLLDTKLIIKLGYLLFA